MSVVVGGVVVVVDVDVEVGIDAGAFEVVVVVVAIFTLDKVEVNDEDVGVDVVFSDDATRLGGIAYVKLASVGLTCKRCASNYLLVRVCALFKFQ